MPYLVKYRAATCVSKVKNELAGSMTYFATAEDAMDSGLFCEKIVAWVEEKFMSDYGSDILGKRYKFATEDEIRKFSRN